MVEMRGEALAEAYLPDHSGGYRVSPGQRRLLTLQNGDQCGPYLTQAIFELGGEIDGHAIRAALELLCQRHEILRTDFLRTPVFGEAAQIVAACARIAWTEHDYSGVSTARAAAALDALGARERGETLLASSGPHLRAAVVRLERLRFALICTIPALRADAASMHVLARQLAQICDVGPEGVVVASESQYADLATALNDFLESAEMEGGRQLWRQLDLPPHAGVFPTVLGKVAATELFRPVELSMSLSHDVMRTLEAVSAELAVPATICLEAAWLTTASRLADGAPLIAAGCSDRRRHDELADAVGLFAACLPLACVFEQPPTFANWIKQLNASRTAAEALDDYCDPNTPIPSDPNAAENGFRFGFAYRDISEAAFAGGVDVRVRRIRSCFDRIDLGLTIERRSDIGVAIIACGDGDRRRAARALGAFKSLLTAALQRPHGPLTEFPLVRGVARRQLLKHGASDLQAVAAGATLHGLVEGQARRTPDAVAVEHGEQRLTYRELDRRANRLARYLGARGVGPESRVAVCLDRSLDLVVAVLATLKSGAAYVPLDPTQHAGHLSRLVRECAAAALIARRDVFRDRCPTGILLVDPAEDRHVLARHSDDAPSPVVSPANLAYVMYTSGSSGAPKGVMIPHAAAVNYLTWCASEYAQAAQGISVLHSSLAFDFSVTPFFLPLLLGQAVRLTHEDGGVIALAEELKSGRRIGLLKLTPSHVRLLDRLLDGDRWPQSVGILVIGGEALTAETVNRWLARAPATLLVNEYGPTETTVGSAAHVLCTRGAETGPVPIGSPIPNTRLFVLDDGMNPVPPGVAGELYIGGEGLARGYFGRPSETAASFVPDPFSARGARLYRTGDRVRAREDGALIFEGRNDRQIKVKGVRIEPVEVESVLGTHAGVAAALVVGVPTSAGGIILTAYLVAKKGHRAVTADVAAHVAERLAAPLVPSAYMWVDELPLNRNGKIDMQRLPKPDVAAAIGGSGTVLRTPTEEILAGIWQRVLDVSGVSFEDNYFMLGGDSIESIQVAALARRRGLNVSVADIFAHPMLRDLAAFADRAAPCPPSRPPMPPFALLSPADRSRIPADAEDAYPLTRLQAGMIFHQQLQPETAVYHDIFSYHLAIPVELTAMRICAAALAERHPALRTRFELTGYDEPLQVVQRIAAPLLTIEDVSHLSPVQQDEAVQAWIENEKARGFDVQSAPLARLCVHKRSDTVIQLTFSFHHSILDGWSDAVILTELFEHYFALLDGSERLPAPPAVRHCECVALERAAIASQSTARYWRELLADCRPFKLPRNAPGRDDRAARHVVDLIVEIPDQLSARIRNLAAAAAVPVKTVLLAAHMRVLAHVSGQSDVLTCMVLSARPEWIDGDRAVGLFINTLPFRLQLIGATWRQLIEQTFAAERDGLPHRAFPIAAMMPHAGIQPPSEALFYFTHYHIFDELNRHPKIRVVDTIAHEVTSFPFVANFSLDPPTRRVALRLAYDSALMANEFATAVGHAYVAALAAMSIDPDARYDAACLLTPSERRRLLQRGCDAVGHWTAPCVTEALTSMVTRRPDAVAVVCDGHEMTYREFGARVDALALRLRASGIGREDVVAVCLDRGLPMLIVYLSVMRAGAVVLPLDPSHPANRLRTIVQDARAKLVVAEPALCDELRNCSCPVLRLEDIPLSSMSDDDAAQFATPHGDAGVYLCYTSGSTGTPKGVLVPHRALANVVQFMAEELALTPADTLVAVTSLAFDIAALELLLPLTTGGRLIIAPSAVGLDPAQLVNILAVHGATVMQATPATWQLLCEGRWRPAPPLHVLCGGEAMSEDLRQALTQSGAAVWNLYGPTETTIWSMAHRVWPGMGGVSLGRPVHGTRIYLLDSHLQPVPDGVPGEIHIAGIGLARGYRGRPDLTAESFLPDPFAPGAGERMYRTGDIARYTPDGRLEFLGRRDRQIKHRGFRIELAEIERAMLRAPGIAQAAVIMHHPADGKPEGMLAFGVAAGAAGVEPTSVLAHLRSELPDYMIPAQITAIDRLPLTFNGKLDRAALAADRWSSHHVSVGREPPQSVLGRALAIILGELTGRPDIARGDDLLSHGLDSLRLVRLKAELDELLGVEVPLRELFHHRTFDDLEAIVRRASSDGEALDRRAGTFLDVCALSDQEVAFQLRDNRWVSA
jgi:nonribosomal peptide synthetase protein BlmX